jgi:hypothetical protein
MYIYVYNVLHINLYVLTGLYVLHCIDDDAPEGPTPCSLYIGDDTAVKQVCIYIYIYVWMYVYIQYINMNICVFMSIETYVYTLAVYS